MFEELYRSDGLAVIGRGLGMRRLLLKFLEKYCLDNFNAVAPQSTPTSSMLNPAVASLLKGSDGGITVNSSSGSALAKKIVFCINATGMEEIIINGLLAEGLMPQQLPKVQCEIMTKLRNQL